MTDAAELEALRQVCKKVYEAIGRAGIHSAITFVEAIDQITAEREQLRARYEKAHADCKEMIALNDELTAERDQLRAQGSSSAQE